MRTRMPGGPLGLAGLTTIAALTATVGNPATAATGRTGPTAHIAMPSRLSPTSPPSGGTVFGSKAPEAKPRAATFFPIAAKAGKVDYGTQINRFGVARGGHTHGGQDVFAPAGTPLRAVRRSVVLDHGSDGGRGNWVALYSATTRKTYVYFHMQAPTRLKTGQRIRGGARVGRLGCTGNCFGAHLHFEVHRGRDANGHQVDPLPSLRRWQRAAKRS
jgi:murein DD-endopeptidase MepM/ murein hydrolase activator NlpD